MCGSQLESIWRTFNNLSKILDWLSKELIIDKLNASRFSLPFVRLTRDYVSNRQQKSKINHAYSSW